MKFTRSWQTEKAIGIYALPIPGNIMERNWNASKTMCT